MARAEHIAGIFGEPSDKNFIIGTTREQGHPVCIDLEKFVQRSAGIFGATGTGKSFLTRVVLAGLMHYAKPRAGVRHAQRIWLRRYGIRYGIAGDGLEDQVCIEGARGGTRGGAKIRGAAPDFNLEISESDVSTSDIELLSRELDLKETTATTLDALWNSFKRIGSANSRP